MPPRDDDGQIIDPLPRAPYSRRRLAAPCLPRLAHPCARLRVARFAARYAHLSFRIADETLAPAALRPRQAS